MDKGDPVEALLRYDPRLRCRCKTRFDRCIRRRTADDGYCDGCRGVRPNGGIREHVIELIAEDAMRYMAADPEEAWARRPAHYAVVTHEQVSQAIDAGLAEQVLNSRFRL